MNRANFRSKVRGKIREERIFARKIGANYRLKRTTARKFASTKTIGIRKIRQIFFNFRGEKSSPYFAEKPQKSRISSNYALITFAQYCIVSCKKSLEQLLKKLIVFEV